MAANTEPDIFREPSSEKDMAWVGSQAEVEVKKPNVESLRDPSFMRNKAGEVIYEDNSLGNSVTEYGRNVIDDHDPVAENMSIETDNAESENSAAGVIILTWILLSSRHLFWFFFIFFPDFF